MGTKVHPHNPIQLDTVVSWIVNTKEHVDLARRLKADRVRYPRGGESNNQLRLWGIMGESMITRVVSEVNKTLDADRQITQAMRPRIDDVLDRTPDVS